MEFFDLFKKKEAGGVVWRNSRGEITCPGDNCPKELNSPWEIKYIYRKIAHESWRAKQ